MVRSKSTTRTRRNGLRSLAAVGVCSGVLLSAGSAFALNAFVSQDLPILAEIAATELASYGELGAILAETAAVVEQVKEYTTIAKTAWGALENLRRLTLDDLRDAALIGVGRAFPELGHIYSDIDDISDLNYRDRRAAEALRGMLWEHAYGPAADYLHSGHQNYLAIADSQELRIRQEAKLMARRLEAEAWDEDCRTTGADGAEGACRAAANRAEIINAILLTDIHETALAELEIHERMLADADRRELDRLYEYDRFFFDAKHYIAASSGGRTYTCTAGQCLYERYADRTAERIAAFRARHPRPYPRRLPLSFAGESE